MKIQGNIVDVHSRRIYHAELSVQDGRITHIQALAGTSEQYILPGFVDAHIHIESSMLVPSEFARLAVQHGTIATVSDPHEIANVLGIAGVRYMIDNGKTTPFKFNFGAPSCVPATSFETAGARIDEAEIEELMAMPDIKYMAEMMNYPGVLFKDPMVMKKLVIAQKYGKPIDGHAPGLRGQDAKNYIAAGISTDHECFTYDEALEKLQMGMKILIREGSAAKNYEALHPLISQYPDMVMLCSDDKHPDDLLEGHINQLVARAIKDGHPLFDVLQAACINPVKHYNLDVGILQIGDPADFIITHELTDFKAIATYINGEKVAAAGQLFFDRVTVPIVNQFNTSLKQAQDFEKRTAAPAEELRVIKVIDKEIVTDSFTASAKVLDGKLVSDTAADILKISVVNRYKNADPAVAFIHGFNIKTGAVASCVGHDSHNIIVVGSDDEYMAKAVNLIIENKGGVSAVNAEQQMVLALPVAGIMSDKSGEEVGQAYAKIDEFVKQDMGCTLTAPFMTLSFMALLVIPDLKLSDLGLFDGKSFEFVN